MFRYDVFVGGPSGSLTGWATLPLTPRRGPRSTAKGCQEAERIAKIDGNDRPRSKDVDHGPRRMPMPRVDQSEVDPEVALPDARPYDGADRGIEAGPQDATCSAEQAQGQCGRQRGEGEREQDVAEHLGQDAGKDDASCPEPVDESAGGRQRPYRQWQARRAGCRLPAASIVNPRTSLQVDDAER